MSSGRMTVLMGHCPCNVTREDDCAHGALSS